ncbi:MAG: hypothetical protein IAG13_11215 [Deltaproteobacteria bacterium]|nr:hypothetical protein [Nannocystaceae bacterium]
MASQFSGRALTGGVIENNLCSTSREWPDETDEPMVPPLSDQLGVAGAGGSTPIRQRAFVIAAGDVSIDPNP